MSGLIIIFFAFLIFMLLKGNDNSENKSTKEAKEKETKSTYKGSSSRDTDYEDDESQYSSNQYEEEFEYSEYENGREVALDVLGLNDSATKEEIKKRYRKLSMIYHPDLNKGDKAAEKKFIEINDAYKYLLDLEKNR